MSHVLSLIAGDAKAALATPDLDRARRSLDAVSARSGAPDWLSDGEACDIPFEGDAGLALDAARAAFEGRRIDVNVVPTTSRRKKLIVADMDSTMIRQECIDELAAEIGLGTKIAAITERAMRGEIEFVPALRERVALLKGLPVETVAKVLSTRIEVMPGAVTLIATMRAAGAYSVLVSGGFAVFVEPIARKIGFDEWRANTLTADADSFTGRVAEPILGAEAKEAALVEATERLGLAREETLAVGDGANDLGMIKRAGFGVGYRAKPMLRRAADATIDHADLAGILFLQGYRREEFAAVPELDD